MNFQYKTSPSMKYKLTIIIQEAGQQRKEFSVSDTNKNHRFFELYLKSRIYNKAISFSDGKTNRILH